MKNVMDTVLSQYANSPTIVSLIESFNDAVDPAADLDAFYNNVWNIQTAVGFGLDNWGKIVGVSRYVTISSTTANFGFHTSTNDTNKPFGYGTFFTGSGATDTYQLADDAYRVLILTKAMSNIVATTSPAINKVLQNLFSGRGACYVNDLGNMQMRYTFQFSLQAYEKSILINGGVLPRPAGVNATILTMPSRTFGFKEAGSSSMPFGYGVFLSTGDIANVA